MGIIWHTEEMVVELDTLTRHRGLSRNPQERKKENKEERKEKKETVFWELGLPKFKVGLALACPHPGGSQPPL